MLLTLCYGCGLRVSEIVGVQVKQIDGERALLHVEQRKGGKDRVVIIAPSLLRQLREYWQQFRTPIWLFPHAQDYQRHISISAAQRIFCKAKQLRGVEKIGGIHSLNAPTGTRTPHPSAAKIVKPWQRKINHVFGYPMLKITTTMLISSQGWR